MPPLALIFVSDFFFNVQVEAALRAAGFTTRLIEHEAALATTEPLSGSAAGLIKQLVAWHPALIVVELSSQAIPWRAWVAALKASPATRRIPVLGFGPHVNKTLQQEALAVGCDEVVAQSRLLTRLPAFAQERARRVDEAALAADCAGALPTLAHQGIALFNQGAYFEAHEELEHAWNAASGPGRELYRGILQVAVAYLQITRGNYAGALKMFLRQRQWLDPLPAVCQGVDVAHLRTAAQAAQAELERLGPARLAEFDKTLLQPVRLV